MSLRPPKGTDDTLPPESAVWRRVLSLWETWAARYGYPLVMTPIFESTDLFERGVGDTTEVVTKQMYTFEDKGGRSITLRPEGTAGVVRAFLNSGVRGAWKAAYSGPMFRYERPQKGRGRQFYQVGVEYLDVDSPLADVEVIELGYRYISATGLSKVELRLNSLGDPNCRPEYLEQLRVYFQENRSDLCDDSLTLIDRNPLRILDCKACAAVSANAPAMSDYLCADCRKHHDRLKSGLEKLGIPYVEDPRLVRGLDYYTRTAFEYIGTGLDAAQNAVGGGGRYDGLAESIGGRPAPGVGFALGIDRIIIALGSDPEIAELDLYVVSETSPEEALLLVSNLRGSGFAVEGDLEGRSVKAQFKLAARSGAPTTIIFHGADQDVSIRTGEDRFEVPIEEVSEWLIEQT
jgi:histidyl-tRNA synthetase